MPFCLSICLSGIVDQLQESIRTLIMDAREDWLKFSVASRNVLQLIRLKTAQSQWQLFV